MVDLENPYRDGRPGKDGKDGLSAYDIAVKHGYVGTEEEWLRSLRGRDGRDGLSVQGPIGEQGPQGANGLSAYELDCQEGFVGTRQEWLQSLKTQGKKLPELQQDILNMALPATAEKKFLTGAQDVIGAVNETKSSTQAAVQTQTAITNMLTIQLAQLNAKVKMIEQQLNK